MESAVEDLESALFVDEELMLTEAELPFLPVGALVEQDLIDDALGDDDEDGD